MSVRLKRNAERPRMEGSLHAYAVSDLLKFSTTSFANLRAAPTIPTTSSTCAVGVMITCINSLQSRKRKAGSHE